MNPFVEEAIKLLKKKLVEKVVAAIVAKSAFFAGSFVNPILTFFIAKIIEILYEQGAFAVEWVWNIVDNNSELKAAVKTRDTLKAVLAAGGNYEEAQNAFDAATDDIIHVRT